MSKKISRRQLIGSGASAAGGLALGGLLGGDSAQAQQGAAAVPFYGKNQAGITTPQQRHIVVAIYDLTISSSKKLQELLQIVTEQAATLTKGQLPDPKSEFAPPAESGVLGEGKDPQNLTVTVGLGASIFDRKGDPFAIAKNRPRHLKSLPEFPGDQFEAGKTDGDLLIQVCADDPIVVHHALRQLERETRGMLIPRVMHRGAQRIVTVDPKAGEVAGARGLLGFKDGTANPAGSDQQLMDKLVWLDGSEQQEPAGTVGGSYMVFRKIRDRIEAWDRETLQSQERLIGRRRFSGAPLDGKREADAPNYAKDPDGKLTPLDSHIRRANPRLPSTERQRILRRGYPYMDGYDSTGLLDAGLLFICFQRNPVQQFEAVKQRLSPRNARPQGLDEYLTCVGGGYFFCPHGAVGSSDFIGSKLFQ